ncbi:MAG: NFACT family protein [Lachnospiraceae bacterium]|nr:NFACT family protein [Lachnospiraceae bacterium]
MAFDGFCIKRIVKEYNELFTGGKISKIIQPNQYDVIFVIKREKETYNLYFSANPSMSYTYLLEDKGEAPMNALNFCMVLRKYIANGKILRVSQKGNERIMVFDIEHLDEMGDLSVKKLILELMGKHSNIILTESDNTILDSIKRVNSLKSSIREVLPKKEYFFPSDISKHNPFDENAGSFFSELFSSLSEDEKNATNVSAFLINSFEGVSKLFAKEVILRSGFEKDVKLSVLDEDSFNRLKDTFVELTCLNAQSENFYVYKRNNSVFEYTLFEYKSIDAESEEKSGYISEFLNTFFKNKRDESVLLQKSSDIVNLLNSIIVKDRKKCEEWDKEIKECDKKETLKKYGELLKAFSHSIERGKNARVLDYYTGEEIDIPMDENKTVIENSNKYFNDYSKAKRRESKLAELREEAENEIKYLEEMLLFTSLSETSGDINQIREELFEKGYLKKSVSPKEKRKNSRIKHYLYDGNYHIYVGKNNIQNEEITFRLATGNDWWFHAKGIGGSHVIVKSDRDKGAKEWDMPNEVFELCGALALINSSFTGKTKGEVDYTRKKHIKKPAEGNTGMVIYHTNYSLVAEPDISRFDLTEII